MNNVDKIQTLSEFKVVTMMYAREQY